MRLPMLALILVAQVSLGNESTQLTTQNPPPPILSKAGARLDDKGPNTNKFTSVSIRWVGGAYYLKIETTQSVPAWITFTVDPSGKFVPLDRGF